MDKYGKRKGKKFPKPIRYLNKRLGKAYRALAALDCKGCGKVIRRFELYTYHYGSRGWGFGEYCRICFPFEEG